MYHIDGVDTIIEQVFRNYAIGKILKKDLTTEDCYIAKHGDFFAHAKTLKRAVDDVMHKHNKNKPIEERIADFLRIYPSLDSIAEHKDLYFWHSKLTGSCAMGRDTFAVEHGLDKESGTMTVRDFIRLTRNAYGGNIIKQLEEAYK